MQDHAAHARIGDHDARADATREVPSPSGEDRRFDPAVGLALNLDGTAAWTID